MGEGRVEKGHFLTGARLIASMGGPTCVVVPSFFVKSGRRGERKNEREVKSFQIQYQPSVRKKIQNSFPRFSIAHI